MAFTPGYGFGRSAVLLLCTIARSFCNAALQKSTCLCDAAYLHQILMNAILRLMGIAPQQQENPHGH
jgi:hypothetical protein